MRRSIAVRRGLAGVVVCALPVILPAPAPAQGVGGGSAVTGLSASGTPATTGRGRPAIEGYVYTPVWHVSG